MTLSLFIGRDSELRRAKGSPSTTDGLECVEVAWHRSSYSTADGPECVEVASTPGTVHVRDSKDPDGPQLTLTPAAWADFIRRAGE
ncbi:hypothetical protein GCM10018785_61580 [Streptomyces longispororuber]|uniref:DUF397 domain-containing protein n=1 Tax=Streptomyces longispororuber TaxID=68230 RepID=A0A919A4R5_9ACTN|nr:DUF397 domain-containing protein [Streptomyces longispororuber]GHE85435.1 hypothetical protein GCM10018785_61580 [Streptomyces longispororuber]